MSGMHEKCLLKLLMRMEITLVEKSIFIFLCPEVPYS